MLTPGQQKFRDDDQITIKPYDPSSVDKFKFCLLFATMKRPKFNP